MSRALADSLLLDVEYADDTRFGAMLSGRAEREIKRRARDVLAVIDHNRGGRLPLVELRDQLMQVRALGELYEAPDRLREDFLYPDSARVRPRALLVERDGTPPTRVELGDDMTADLARWLSDWQRDAVAPHAPAPAALFRRLDELGCFTERGPAAPLPRHEVTFVGHATVMLQTEHMRLLVDPFLVPAVGPALDGYRPLSPGELGADIVLITHSHPDHFHPGSLLRLGADVPIVVPTVARESVLAVDMAARLTALGFRQVRTLAWGASLSLGEFRIHALPFFGEQPTGGDVLHPEVRNQGNTYLVEGGGRRYAFVADAGRDAAGDCTGIARAARRVHGPADVVFGGYRVWGLYPVHLLRSSVSRYVPFVPRGEWSVRQTLMNGAHELVDVAEAWSARFVVPYADGGAPWYWRRGLGPKLDERGGDNPSADPRPEEVAACAGRRSTWLGDAIASPVSVEVMRPGESLALRGGEAVRVRHRGHAWPYPTERAGECVPPPASQPEHLALARKKVLLRVLAVSALERFGMSLGAGEAQALADTVRRRAGLETRAEMERWMEEAGMSREAFAQLVFEWACSNRLEAHLRGEIDARLPGQLALEAMRWRGSASRGATS